MILTHGANSLGSGGGDIPAEYTQIEYIKCDTTSGDNAYFSIDNIPINIGDNISLTYMIDSSIGSSVVVSGWRTAGNSHNQELLLQYSGKMTFDTSMNSVGYQNFTTAKPAGKKYNITKVNNVFSLLDYESGITADYNINNGTYVQQTKITFPGSTNWATGEVYIYEFSIKRGDDYILKLVPIVDTADMTNCGLYDIVGQTVYRSSYNSNWKPGPAI